MVSESIKVQRLNRDVEDISDGKNGYPYTVRFGSSRRVLAVDLNIKNDIKFEWCLAIFGDPHATPISARQEMGVSEWLAIDIFSEEWKHVLVSFMIQVMDFVASMPTGISESSDQLQLTVNCQQLLTEGC